MSKINPKIIDQIFAGVEIPDNDQMKEQVKRQKSSLHMLGRWANMDPVERKKRLDRHYSEEYRRKASELIKSGKGINSQQAVKKRVIRKQQKYDNHRSQSEWQEIYLQCWGADRNSKKQKNYLAKKYNLSLGTLKTLMFGPDEINLPKRLKDTHLKRLLEWQKRYGDLRFIYTIILPAGKKVKFDRLSDAGKWMVDEKYLPRPILRNNKLNYGNIVYQYFQQRKRTGTIIPSGKFKGWQFIQTRRIID